MLNPIFWLLTNVIGLIELALFVWFVLSLLIMFNIVNRWNPVVSQVMETLSRLLEPLLRPIRKYLPDIGGVDLSPLVLILFLRFINYSLVYVSYNYL